MEEFLILLDRVKNGTATAEERIEYFRKLQSGHYDHLIEEDFDAAFKETPLPEIPQSRDKIRRQIHKRYIGRSRTVPTTVRILTLAAAIIAAVIAGVWLIASPGNVTAEENGRVYKTGDARRFIRLPDGSSVVLDERSEIQYCETSSERQVTLYGNAYFNVVHDPRKSFKVRSDGIITRVLGTKFSVSSGEREVRISVVSGLVEVSDSIRSFGKLTAKQEFTFDRHTRQAARSDIDSSASLTLTSRYLIMDDVDLDGAAELIEQHYHVTVEFASEELKRLGINATFVNDESLPHVLEMVTAAINCDYTIKGDTVVLMPRALTTHANP